MQMSSSFEQAFFLTKQPVRDLEHEFAIDGTCNPNTIKANWESSKEKILKLAGKQHTASSAKERKKHQFEKVIIAAGTTFKIITTFAITKSSTANESPYLKPLLGQILEFYSEVFLICLDAGYLSRENVTAIERIHAIPRIFPKKGVTLKAKGSQAWKKMLLEFLEDTQNWLRQYHKRSIIETINSTMKRIFPRPIMALAILREE